MSLLSLFDSSSQCHGLVCSMWLWHCLVTFTYFLLMCINWHLTHKLKDIQCEYSFACWLFWNFACAFLMVWKCSCALDIIFRYFFIIYLCFVNFAISKTHFMICHIFILLRPMEFSIKIHTIKSGWSSIAYIEGSQVIISKQMLYSFLCRLISSYQTMQILMKCCIMHGPVRTMLIHTCLLKSVLGVSGLQRV